MPARSAAVEAMTMMLPERCGMKQRLATAWLSANTLDAFSVMTLFHASRGCSSAFAPQLAPALLTRISYAVFCLKKKILMRDAFVECECVSNFVSDLFHYP